MTEEPLAGGRSAAPDSDVQPAAGRARLPPIPSVLLAATSVTIGAAFAKRLFPVLGAAATVSVRVGFAAVVLALASRPPLRRLGWSQWRLLVPYGLCLGTMNLAFYEAIARLPLGLGVTIEFLGPLGLAVVTSRRALDLVWVALAGLGVTLIAPWSGVSRATALDPVGVLFALAAGTLWATYILLGSRVARVLPGAASVATGMLVGAAALVPVGLATGRLAALLSPRLFGAGVAVAVLSSTIPYTLELNALRSLPPRTFGILMSLEPAIAALSGLLLLGERLTGAQWLAVTCVIAASTGVTWTARRVDAPLEV